MTAVVGTLLGLSFAALLIVLGVSGWGWGMALPVVGVVLTCGLLAHPSVAETTFTTIDAELLLCLGGVQIAAVLVPFSLGTWITSLLGS